MGYNTSYGLDYIYENKNYLDEETEGKILSYLDEHDLSYCIENSCKWYNHDQDMWKMSQQFPDVLFTLYGSGEENEDMWKKYYLNGKSQYAPAVISYTPFNPDLLS